MLKPLKSKIVVKPVPRIKSEILDVVMDEKDNQGTVMAVGSEASRYVQPGDFIRFGTMGRDASQEYLKFPEYHDEEHGRLLILDWKDVCFVEERQDAA